MNKFRVITLLIVSIFILSIFMVVPIYASNVWFTVDTPEEEPYIYEDNGTQLDYGHGLGVIRYADGTHYIIYKFDLDKTKGRGELSITISNDYVISASTDTENWVVLAYDETGDRSHNNRTEEIFDITEYMKSDAEALYIKFHDQTEEDGWGPGIWEIYLNFSGTADSVETPEPGTGETAAPSAENTISPTPDNTPVPTVDSTPTPESTPVDNTPDKSSNTLMIIGIVVFVVILVGSGTGYVIVQKKNKN